jgi:membrane-associated phospholipid phosphatase
MITIIQGDIWITTTFQNMGEWMTPIMEFFTLLGYPQAYMVIIALIYWSVNREAGLRMALFLPVVSCLNSILKQAFHAPRPYWVDPGIKAIRVSNGFGMPSGHAQGATVWLYAAAMLRRRWFWVVTIIVVFLVGVSRIYLGVHFSTQVLAGWLIGIVVIILFVRYESAFLGWFLNRKLSSQLWFGLLISLIFMTLGGFFVMLLSSWEMPAEWIVNASDDLAGTGESILSSMGLAAVAGNTGGFLGVSVAALLLHRRNGFQVKGEWWKRLLRSFAGLLMFVILYMAVRLAEPEQSTEWLYVIWRFGGFFIISFSAIYLIPLLLIKVGLLKSGSDSIS